MKVKKKFKLNEDGSLDLPAWFLEVEHRYALPNTELLQRACILTQKTSSQLENALRMAEMMLDLKFDQETAAAAIASYAETTPEHLTKELNGNITKLIQGMKLVELNLQNQATHTPTQIDKVRKMLLAIAADLRVVLLKLAERLCFMRSIKSHPHEERARYAKEILNIYAPLANRLGIGQLKWELEDIAFHYLHPETYKKIAGFLAEKREEREERIQQFMNAYKEKLSHINIEANITGRAKHIYSIYNKAKRYHLNLESLYDYSATRVLVPNIEDCYRALSIAHESWTPIIKEFDDYIANPKKNGYQSIHTAIIDEHGKQFEIQIRTHKMHEEAESGVAAHWMYKENRNHHAEDLLKINFLRQLIDWHRDLSKENMQQANILAEQIYVVTPAGDILDLPQGATPIDFAYHVHSELGHRCRGAKVNGRIVPLTYALQTGDKVEIITQLQATPSRDWLNSELGYVKSSRARSKIAHWFKHQDFVKDVAQGRQMLDKELARHGLSKTLSLAVIARHFKQKDEDALFAAIAFNNIRVAQVVQLLDPKAYSKHQPTHPKATEQIIRPPVIGSATDFLTILAKCCQPKRGDDILGYITRGRGISVHKKDCRNIKSLKDPRRFFHITWDKPDKSK